MSPASLWMNFFWQVAYSTKEISNTALQSFFLPDACVVNAKKQKLSKRVRYSAQHSTAQHSTAQHSTAQHSTAQHSTAQHSTAQHSILTTSSSFLKKETMEEVIFLFGVLLNEYNLYLCTIRELANIYFSALATSIHLIPCRLFCAASAGHGTRCSGPWSPRKMHAAMERE